MREFEYSFPEQNELIEWLDEKLAQKIEFLDKVETNNILFILLDSY